MKVYVGVTFLRSIGITVDIEKVAGRVVHTRMIPTANVPRLSATACSSMLRSL